MQSLGHAESPTVEIVEQPESTYRFRYVSEVKSVQRLVGASNSDKEQTFPSIKVTGCSGECLVIVSCVTPNSPHMPHPASVVSHTQTKRHHDDMSYCRIGVIKTKSQVTGSKIISLDDLGLVCPTNKEVKSHLDKRRELRIDPFKTGYPSPELFRKNLSQIRLCFQVFMMDGEKIRLPFPPVVSSIIRDQKTLSKLTITYISHDSGPASGSTSILIVCDKVNKDDIKVVFSKERWRKEAVLQDVFKGNTIRCLTPAYKDVFANEQVCIHISRKSDGMCSDGKHFTYTCSYTSQKSLNKTLLPMLHQTDNVMVCPYCQRTLPFRPATSQPEPGSSHGPTQPNTTPLPPMDTFKLRNNPNVHSSLPFAEKYDFPTTSRFDPTLPTFDEHVLHKPFNEPQSSYEDFNGLNAEINAGNINIENILMTLNDPVSHDMVSMRDVACLENNMDAANATIFPVEQLLSDYSNLEYSDVSMEDCKHYW